MGRLVARLLTRPARRRVFVHIGLPGSGGGFLESAIAAHATHLAQVGVGDPTRSAEEMFRAAVEIRRQHAAWGLRRRDVEGTWAQVCRRIQRGPRTALLSHELLAGCTRPQADLLLDTLAGTEVHVVVTARRRDAERHELADLVARWGAAVGDPARVHVLVAPVGIDPAGWIWHQVGDLVGFEAARLSLGGARPPAYLRRAGAPQLTGQ